MSLFKLRFACFLVSLILFQSAAAQQREATTSATPDRDLEAWVQRLSDSIRDAAEAARTDRYEERLDQMSRELDRADRLDAAEIERLLSDVRQDLRSLRREAEEDGNTDLSERLFEIEQTIEDAIDLARGLEAEEYEDDESFIARWKREREERFKRFWPWPAAHDHDGRAEPVDGDTSGSHHTNGYAYAGGSSDGWPFSYALPYRYIPAWRYNRVEGLVVGIGARPLNFDDEDRLKIIGQVGYAFGLEKVRYEVGGEVRLTDAPSDRYGLKVGGAYRRNTATNDTWKTTWTENSLAAFFFKNDFFDYYEVEGWSAYAVGRLTPYAQLTAGYFSEDYRSLDRNVHWSLFGGDGFRVNPPVDEDRIGALKLALEAGAVRSYEDLPRGAALRTEIETSRGMGGDFEYTRLTADARAYLPTGRYGSLALRLRGGTTSGTVPYQKGFTLGGVGSVRAYPQNAFYGTDMLLGNVEYILGDMDLGFLDDFHLLGFADFGWTNGWGARRSFDVDDVLPSAGFGIGLDERLLRLELAWPLKDAGFGLGPSLWLRLAPTF